LTGYVDDLRPYFWAATAVVAPLVYGTGIQNKVLEAMACGVPVVASSKATDGIAALSGRDLLIGTSDEDLARHVSTLLQEPQTRARIAAGGRRFVATRHNWNELCHRLTEVYENSREQFATDLICSRQKVQSDLRQQAARPRVS
jgi:glycosyltransferase involved in cell wall biosynthesis